MSWLASILELRLPLQLVPEFARLYSTSMATLPPQLNQTFLLQSEVDGTVLRIHDYWLRVVPPGLVGDPPYLHPCMAFVEAEGLRPVSSRFFVIARGHPMIGHRMPPG